MDRLLYNSTVGASNIERALAVRANNLANVSTTGFRADFAQAQAYWAEGDGRPGVFTESPSRLVSISARVR